MDRLGNKRKNCIYIVFTKCRPLFICMMLGPGYPVRTYRGKQTLLALPTNLFPCLNRLRKCRYFHNRCISDQFLTRKAFLVSDAMASFQRRKQEETQKRYRWKDKGSGTTDEGP